MHFTFLYFWFFPGFVRWTSCFLGSSQSTYVSCLIQDKIVYSDSMLTFLVWTGDLTAAFDRHLAIYGGLDICINSAGIGNRIPFRSDETDGTTSWKHTINVNLMAIIDCTRLAVCSKINLLSIQVLTISSFWISAIGSILGSLEGFSYLDVFSMW